MKIEKQEYEAIKKELSELLPRGSFVFIQIKSVARSGMSRHVSLYIVKEKRILNITPRVAKLLGYTLNRDDFSIRVDGCGFDVGLDTVMSLDKIMTGNHDAKYLIKMDLP